MVRILVLAFVLGAEVGAGEFPIPDGRRLIEFYGCLSCHAIEGKGGNAAPDLTLVGFRRGREWLNLWLRDPQDWKHDTKMPDFRLPAPERDAIVEYLASLKSVGPRFKQSWTKFPGASDPAPMGRVIFKKAGCVACHGPLGAGGHPNNNVPGNVIPALRPLLSTYTLQELKKRIGLGSIPIRADASMAGPLVEMPAWGKILDGREIDAVAAYLMTLKLRESPMDTW